MVTLTTLQQLINLYCEDEDAAQIGTLTENIANLLYSPDDDDLHVSIERITKFSKNIIEIRWRGFSVRRGVMYVTQSEGNWIGFTTAGNGTPAYIFPVNDIFAETIYWEILSRTLL
jgi:hypothetical protein